MPRTKVTKRKKGAHSAEDMRRAILLHRKGHSIRKAAKECNIYYPTLQRYVKKYINVSASNLQNQKLTPNYEVQRVFSDEQERDLAEYITECALKFYGLTAKDVRRIAFQMAVINDIKIPDTWKRDNMAGVEWLRCYRARHPELSLKKPEACSLARATAFNPTTVKSFFENLKKVYDRNPSFGNGCRVYNLDETATTTVQKPQKVLAPKGKQNIGKITSGEKGTLVTTCAIVCASGQAVPPVLVFPRKVYKDFMLHGAPAGSLGLASASGWMNAELFVKVMEHFIHHTSASPENPALLLMDNHESHLSIEALDLAKRSGVTVLTLHPHTTAKLQPLDVGLNGPFKVFYNTAVDSWLLRNPGKQMTIYNIAECVGQAYPKAMTPVNITSAFRKCGIFPYDPDVFTEIDFLPSSVTDRAREVSPSSDVTNAESPIPDENIFAQESRNVESPSLLDNEHVSTPAGTQSASRNLTMEAGPSNAWPEMARATTPTTETEPSVEASCSKPFKSPKEFMPPLKAGPRTGTRKPRKLGRSMVATDTPEKNLIEEEKKKAQLRKSATKIKRPVLCDVDPKGKKKPQKKQKEDQETETSDEDEKEVEYLAKATPATKKEPVKLEPRSGARQINNSEKSMVANNTQEKKKIEGERKKTPLKKSAPKMKRPLSDETEGPKAKKRLQKKLKIKTEPETSEEEEEEVICLSESDLSGFEEEEEKDDFDDLPILKEPFQKLKKKPKEGDYVLIQFVTKKMNVYYAAIVVEKLNSNYGVSYMRVKSKEKMKFYMPLEPDLAEVSLQEIKMILPKPQINGTKSRSSTYIFPLRLCPSINMR